MLLLFDIYNLLLISSLTSAILFFINSKHVAAELPQELDPFLALLFETEDCAKFSKIQRFRPLTSGYRSGEGFLADGKFLSVATTECKPYTCDFPRQLCMRDATLYNEEKANQCKDIPTKCIIAANGGAPLSPRAIVTTSSPPTITGGFKLAPERGPKFPDNALTASKSPICEQGVPEGRFCGFALKFAFNKETGSCDQFWWPGCRSENTNDNLFDTLANCREATEHCRGGVYERSTTIPPYFIGSTTQRPDVTVPIHGRFSGVGGFAPQPQVTQSPYGQGQMPSSFGNGFSQLFSGPQGGANGVSGLLQGLTGGGGGNNGGTGSNVGGGEYGGGALGGGGAVTQPPNIIRLIANSIREVREKGSNGRLDPNQFASFLQSALG